MSDFPVGFYFQVSILDMEALSIEMGGLHLPGSDIAFQEISGIEQEMNLKEVKSGGENRFKYRLPEGVTYKNLVLKRAAVVKFSPLAVWCTATLESGFALPVIPLNLQVQVLNAEGETCLSWTFVKTYPVKWSFSDLKSQENSILIETLELAYQYYFSLSFAGINV